MSISKLQIINDDSSRLNLALILTLLAFSTAFVGYKHGVNSMPLLIAFKNLENSLFQEESLDAVGELSTTPKKEFLITPEILSQKVSTIQLFIRARKTPNTTESDTFESEEIIKKEEEENNAGSSISESSTLVIGAKSETMREQGVLVQLAPVYPQQARIDSLEGNTTLKLTLRPSGLVKQIKILQSSGHPVLDDEAVSALSRWVFQRDKNQLGSREITLTVEFVLEDYAISDYGFPGAFVDEE